MSNISIWPVGRTLLGATFPGQSGPGGDGKEQIAFPKAPALLEPRHKIVYVIAKILVVRVYPSVGMQSVYSTALVDWAISNPGIFSFEEIPFFFKWQNSV